MTARVALRALTVVFAALMLCAASASAQRGPYRDYRSDYERGPGYQNGRGNEPGKFDYYILSLSWSPTYCAELPRGASDPQCDRRRPRPYAFVLHGLWPQFERGWPESCPSRDRGFVPRPVANRMLDIMPSDKLVFHEYRKHGTCTGLGVDGYFALSRSLYEKIKDSAALRRAGRRTSHRCTRRTHAGLHGRQSRAASGHDGRGLRRLRQSIERRAHLLRQKR